MIVYLIGFMGSGKTSLGKRLANKLGYSFADSDQIIEQHTGKSIPDLFQEIGEDGFRLQERKWLYAFESDNVVCSVGGGLPCFNDNLERINQTGVSVYLELSPQALTDRLMDSKSNRPLVEKYKDDPEQLLEYVEKTLSEREKFYRQAKIIFPATNVTAEKLDELVKLIREQN